jgi:hypothetical protein
MSRYRAEINPIHPEETNGKPPNPVFPTGDQHPGTK